MAIPAATGGGLTWVSSGLVEILRRDDLLVQHRHYYRQQLMDAVGITDPAIGEEEFLDD